VRRRARTAVAGFAAATLLLAAVPAGAAEAPYAATADAAGVTISLDGDALAALARTAVELAPDAAEATAIPLLVGGEPVASAGASSIGEPDDDEACVAAPGGLPLSPEIEVLCAWAETDDGYAAAVAEGLSLELSLDGEVAAPLLDLLDRLGLDAVVREALGEFEVDVDDLRDEVDGTLHAIGTGLRSACFAELDALDLTGLTLVDDALDDLLALIAAFDSAPLEQVPDRLGALGTLIGELPESCETLGEVIGRVLGLIEGLPTTEAVLGDALLRELIVQEGIDLAVVVTETGSEAADEDGLVYAASELALVAVVIDVDLLGSLEALVEALLAPLGSILDDLAPIISGIEDLVDEVEDVLPAENLPGEGALDLPTLPAPSTVVTEILDADLLELLGSEEALLEAVVFSGGAWVVHDRDDDGFDADYEAGELHLDGTLFGLPFVGELGDQLQVLLLEGVEAADLADSPLAGLLAVDLGGGSVDEEATVLGLDGFEATSTGVSLAVLGALDEDALVQVDVLSATAAVGIGEPEVVTPPVQPADGTPTLPAPGPGDDAPRKGTLPDTGGGAALLGLAAIAAAAALRRRAD
jgi:hypothetical protein